jgi:hypothetical protein
MMNWLTRRRVDGRALAALIHGRMLRRRRQERGRSKITRRPGDDPTLSIGSPSDAFDIATALLESASRDHKTEQFWASHAATPLAGLLYAASVCGNGGGIAWVGYASTDTGWTGWREAFDICRRADVPVLADALLRVVKTDPRQRESVRHSIRAAIAPCVAAGMGR